MNLTSIFLLQFLLSLTAWGAVGAFLVRPWLGRFTREEALLRLTVPHAFRHVGMVFLVPALVDGPPERFAGAAAYGDLATGVLALIALFALRRRWAGAITLAWATHVIGSIDLLNALRQVEAVPHLGTAWFIPTMFVPLLLVTHVLGFRVLTARKQPPAPVRATSS